MNNFAFLERTTVDNMNFETFTLSDRKDNANETAMIKGRTLLAYLWQLEKLKFYISPDGKWCTYIAEQKSSSQLKLVEELLELLKSDLDEKIVAVMPVNYMQPSVMQPGIIAVRYSQENVAIMVASFFESSRRWLQSHRTEFKMLEIVHNNDLLNTQRM